MCRRCGKWTPENYCEYCLNLLTRKAFDTWPEKKDVDFEEPPVP